MSSDVSRILKETRNQGRLTTLEYAELVFDDFMEPYDDRHSTDDGAVVGGIAHLDGHPVTVTGIQKGRSLQENLKHNFDQPSLEGYRKALRLMKQAKKFDRSIVTFTNTAGIYPGVGTEERGQGEVTTHNLLEMNDLKVPIITTIIGERSSGDAPALAAADKAWMLERSMYTASSLKGFTSILWKDGSRAIEATELMKITAGEFYNMGVVGRVIPKRGYFSSEIAEMIETDLVTELDEFSQLPLE